jgi:hypothetical protein
MSIRSALFIIGILVGGAVLFVIGAFGTIMLLTARHRSDFPSHSAAACGEVCGLAGMVAEYATPPKATTARSRKAVASRLLSSPASRIMNFATA